MPPVVSIVGKSKLSKTRQFPPDGIKDIADLLEKGFMKPQIDTGEPVWDDHGLAKPYRPENWKRKS